MNKIIESHKAFENLDLNRLKNAKKEKAPFTEKIFVQTLPEKKLTVTKNFGKQTIKELLTERKSIRDYSNKAITFMQLSNILHYSYGIKNYRDNAYNQKKYPISYSPSAGGLQPFDVYVFVSKVEDLETGLYYYSPMKDSLLQIYRGRPELDLAEYYISDFPIYAAVNIFIVSNIQRFEWKYGYRGYRFANIDCDILAENICLLSVSQKLGSCMIAAFSNEKVSEILNLSDFELPLLAISIGDYDE